MSASKTLRASMRQFYSRNNCLLPQQFPARTLPRLQPSISRQSPTIHSAHSFSTSSPLLARKQKGQKKDQRISQFLSPPVPCPPLRHPSPAVMRRSEINSTNHFQNYRRHNPLSPPTPNQPPAPPVLPFPPPPPLDHPPRLATLPP